MTTVHRYLPAATRLFLRPNRGTRRLRGGAGTGTSHHEEAGERHHQSADRSESPDEDASRSQGHTPP